MNVARNGDSYCSIEGFPVHSQQSSNIWVAVCTLSATLGVLLLSSSAMKQLHVVSSAPFSTATLSTNAPLASYSRSISQPRLFPSDSKFLKRHQQVYSQKEYLQSSASSESRAMAAVGAICMAITGAMFYLMRRSANGNPNIVLLATTGSRPTLADTKLKFLILCDQSIPNMYNIPLQELLAQHHLLRHNSKYVYDEIFALGIITVIDQLLEGLPKEDVERIEAAYFGGLGDDATLFKADAASLEEWAASKGKDLNFAGDDPTSEKLKAIASRIQSGQFQYNKFFSIGLFQLLQQSGLTDPEHFNTLVTTMSLDKERVTKDLKVYKDLLKRLEMAKDMKEKFLERERKKQQERLAQKAAKTPA